LHLKIKVFKTRKKVKKVDFYTNLSFSISIEWVKKNIVSFKRHLNYLSTDAKVYKK